MAKKQLYAGVATANITPPVGIDMRGFAGRGPSVGIADELYATALVLRDGDTRAAIVGLDLIGLDITFSQRVFEEAARRARVPADNVLLCCSHTHYGPAVTGYDRDPATSDEAAYMADLKFKIAGAVKEAGSSLCPVTASVGYAESGIGINRRERQPDGRIVLGRNPEGPVDRQVIVLRLDRANGEPLACAINFACHAVSLTHRGRLITPDFPGVACDLVEDLTGAQAMYLQGACGNINPVIMQHDLDSPRRLGAMLGAAAIQAYESAEPIQATPLRVARRQVKLPPKSFDSLDEARRAVAELEAELEQLKATKAHKGRIHWANTRLQRDRTALESLQTGKPLPPVLADQWAVRIGDLGLATAPGEIFCEIGRAVKDRSPIKHTMFLGYTNGLIGYVPVPEAYPEGGYEVSHASKVGPGAAGTITDAAVALLKRLKGR